MLDRTRARCLSRVRQLAVALLCLAFSLLSFVARADEADEDESGIHRLRKEAQQAVADGRWADAFDKYEAVVAAGGDVWDVCNVGRFAFRLRKLPKAFASLTRCVELGRQIPPAEVSARDEKFLKKSREELDEVRQRVARLVVRVDKPGAAIVVDGERVDVSPNEREIGLEPGLHRVKVTLGTASAEGEYDIKAGELRKVTFCLTEPPPALAPTKSDAPAKSAALTKCDAPAKDTPVKNDAPAKSDAPAKPSGSLPRVPEERTWPWVVGWTSMGVAVVGLTVTVGAVVAHSNALNELDRRDANVKSEGCGDATHRSLECALYFEAFDRTETAAMVVGVATATTSVLAGGLALASYLGSRSTSTRIQAAPTLGGMVIRGTF